MSIKAHEEPIITLEKLDFHSLASAGVDQIIKI